jgi:ADP-ribose pyrophosphatase YjhB (NUDIX family)
MTHVHLATALVRRGGRILLVASRYPNHPLPLWNLPGGRQQPGELLVETALRELREETGLDGSARGLCYVSESYDNEVHFINTTFDVHAEGEPMQPQVEGDHVVEAAWVSVSAIAERLTIAVVREPLIAFLEREQRYAGYARAGITVEFPD